jgi:hypothetical protein
MIRLALGRVEYTKKGVVCQEKQPMITNTNQADFAKMSACGLQEVLFAFGKCLSNKFSRSFSGRVQ